MLYQNDNRLPYNPKLKERARELRANMTKPEQIIWFQYLQKLDLRVLRQRPIDNFIVDFYIPSLNLVIEINGDSHYTENSVVYDQERTDILKGLGLTVLRFTNDEIMNNFSGVQEFLNNYFQAT